MDCPDIGGFQDDKPGKRQLVEAPCHCYGRDDIFLPPLGTASYTFLFLGHFFGQFHSVIFKLYVDLAHGFLYIFPDPFFSRRGPGKFHLCGNHPI